MAKTPPDDPWADVVDQVRDALKEADITDPGTHEALVEGLRSALDSLGWGEERPPDVTVVEGGKGDDEPRGEGVRPDLRVAEPVDDDEGSSPVVTSVRVFRRGAAGDEGEPDPWEPPLAEEGWIRCEGPDNWQTVFRGEQARPYRIACDEGGLRIALEGSPADALGPSQSMDVEARLVRVCAAGERARGTYVRLMS